MNHKNIFLKTFKTWLPLALVAAVFWVTLYWAVQQNYRMSANDPQIQIAEDIASAISLGAPADSVAPQTGNTDIRQSLSPFLMIYDDSGKLIGSSAILDGKNPEFPTSVFDRVKKSGEDWITWQPQKGLRYAVVVSRYSGKDQSGYVVVGRSMREIEKRISILTEGSAASLVFVLILSFALIFVLKKFWHSGH